MVAGTTDPFGVPDNEGSERTDERDVKPGTRLNIRKHRSVAALVAVALDGVGLQRR